MKRCSDKPPSGGWGWIRVEFMRVVLPNLRRIREDWEALKELKELENVTTCVKITQVQKERNVVSILNRNK